LNSVEGGIILTERISDGPFKPSSIMMCGEYGVAIFMGMARTGYVVKFVKDSGFYR
jgi:hypothetical protein